MREFIYGTTAQYEKLWERLTGEQSKRIRFNVMIPGDQSAQLYFETNINGSGVVVKLKPTTVDIPLSYNGYCDSLRKLVLGQSIVCSTVKELKTLFTGMRVEYPTIKQADSHMRIVAENVQQAKADSGSWVGVQNINSAELAAKIKERIVGQDAQIEGLAERVCNHLKKPNPKKPLTVMLPGPTGTGKTETARAIASELQARFGSNNFPFILINCNEYQEDYRISQLIGSPAGYVGHNESCVMEPVREAETALIVFDEYEKAHSSIHTAVMNWMDTGTITLSKPDENGKMEYDCTKYIIIMTSNIDMKRGIKSHMKFNIQNDIASSIDSAQDLRMTNDACRKIMVANGFKPEIASRISYFFEYKQLTPKDMKKIMAITLKNKAKEYGINVVEIADELVESMNDKYQISSFGVRSLESDLDSLIGDAINEGIDCNAEYKVAGTVEHIILTRR